MSFQLAMESTLSHKVYTDLKTIYMYKWEKVIRLNLWGIAVVDIGTILIYTLFMNGLTLYIIQCVSEKPTNYRKNYISKFKKVIFCYVLSNKF